MKVVVTANEDGLDSSVAMHFGHCNYFVFADVENGEIKNVDFVKNQFEEHEPGEVPQYVVDKGVEAVITGNLGQKAEQWFNSRGVKVYRFSGTVKDALKSVGD